MDNVARRHKIRRNYLVWSGSILFILSVAFLPVTYAFAIPFGNTDYDLLLVSLFCLFLLVSYVLMIIGCNFWARYKGRSGWWCVLGIVSYIGFILLALIPNKNENVIVSRVGISGVRNRKPWGPKQFKLFRNILLWPGLALIVFFSLVIFYDMSQHSSYNILLKSISGVFWPGFFLVPLLSDISILTLLYSISFIIYIVGCVFCAKYKGISGWFGLAGVFWFGLASLLKPNPKKIG